MQECKYASVLSRNIFDPNLTWPKLFQTERTWRLAHLPSFCELVPRGMCIWCGCCSQGSLNSIFFLLKAFDFKTGEHLWWKFSVLTCWMSLAQESQDPGGKWEWRGRPCPLTGDSKPGQNIFTKRTKNILNEGWQHFTTSSLRTYRPYDKCGISGRGSSGKNWISLQRVFKDGG